VATYTESSTVGKALVPQALEWPTTIPVGQNLRPGALLSSLLEKALYKFYFMIND